MSLAVWQRGPRVRGGVALRQESLGKEDGM
jgi:hypothetical protein